jgi:hypothetical protein
MVVRDSLDKALGEYLLFDYFWRKESFWLLLKVMHFSFPLEADTQ